MIIALIFATVVAWWNLGLPHLVFSPKPDRFTAGSKLLSNRPGRPFLVLDRPWWSANPLGILCPDLDAVFVVVLRRCDIALDSGLGSSPAMMLYTLPRNKRTVAG